MPKLFGTMLLVALMSFGASAPEAAAQGICWNGTIVKNLKDCPKVPGAKFQSLGGTGKSAAPQGKLGVGEKRSKAGFIYLKMGEIAGETGGTSRGKGVSLSPPPKGDCMSCAD